MTVCDTSVLVAAFSSWHEHHGLAVAGLERSTHLIGHTALETLSVLTRLPEPFRAQGALVIEFLDSWFPGRPLALAAAQAHRLPATLVGGGVIGGAVYDGLVGSTAAGHGHRLLSLDRRAVVTYERIGAEHELLG